MSKTAEGDDGFEPEFSTPLPDEDAAAAEAYFAKMAEELAAKYRRFLVGIARGMGVDEHDAEVMAFEVIGDACIQAMQGKLEYHNNPSFSGWLRRVLRNRVYNRTRDNQHKPASLDLLVEKGIEPTSESLEIDQLALRAFLDAEIARIPAHYQRVVRMRFYGGYTPQEISRLTGLTAKQVSQQLYLALQLLRKQMEGPDLLGAT